MPKISIIIPVYNVRPYLKQCLDSVINQTMKDIEILIVDDGSSDGSEQLCDEYAALDERIQVIHKRNAGVSCARNDGIDASEGNYLMFVDSDDWVEPDYCALPFQKSRENGSDLVLFSYYLYKPDGTETMIKTKTQEGPMTEKQAMRRTICADTSAFRALYHRKLFETVRFPAGKNYEDVGTCHKLVHNAEKIYMLNRALTHYRWDREGSISTAAATKNQLVRKEMATVRILDLIDWGYERYSVVDAFSVLLLFGSKGPEQKFYVDIVRKRKWRGLQYLRWKQKVMLVVFLISPSLFELICNGFGKREAISSAS